MQELSIVSLTSELSSETVTKELRGATYDPLNETVFAVFQRNIGEKGSTLYAVPEKSTSEEHFASSS